MSDIDWSQLIVTISVDSDFFLKFAARIFKSYLGGRISLEQADIHRADFEAERTSRENSKRRDDQT